MSRTFLISSFGVSLFCLAYIVGQRLPVHDFFAVLIFKHLLVAQDYLAALLSLALLGVGLLVAPNGAKQLLVFIRILGNRPKTVALAAFVAFSVGALFAYHNHPLSMDEYSAYFQSQVFASGDIKAQFPLPLLDWLVPPPFQNGFLIASRQTGEVISGYLPGFALILTPFTFLGIPWACNPAIGALSIIVLHRITLELTKCEEAAGWAVLFAIASTAFSVNAMSYYSMPTHLLLNALYTLLLLRPTPRRALFAGIAGGFALVLHNPFPHMLYAMPWVIWLVLRRDYRCLALLMLGYLPIAVGLGYGWLLLMGDLRGAGKTAPNAEVYGAAWTMWMAEVQKVVRVPSADILEARLAGLVKLSVWAVPGLLVLAWLGFLHGKQDVRYRLLLASAMATLLGYFFIPFDQGHGWGYRYFHSAWGVLPVLAAGAMVRPSGQEPSSQSLTAVVGAIALSSLLLSTALQVWQVHFFVQRHVGQVPLLDPGKAQVAFVDLRRGYYTIDLVQNHPKLERNTIMMVSYGAEHNARMARRLAPNATQVSSGRWGELWLLDEKATSIGAASPRSGADLRGTN